MRILRCVCGQDVFAATISASFLIGEIIRQKIGCCAGGGSLNSTDGPKTAVAKSKVMRYASD